MSHHLVLIDEPEGMLLVVKLKYKVIVVASMWAAGCPLSWACVT